MHYASTVLYVDSVPEVLDFYLRAFGLRPQFVDPDVQLPGRDPGAAYHYAILDVPGGALQLATHALGALLMPGYARPPGGPSGVEIAFFTPDVPAAFDRAVGAGAEIVAEPREMPWGQTVAYVRGIEGTFIGICSPLPGDFDLVSAAEEVFLELDRREERR